MKKPQPPENYIWCRDDNNWLHIDACINRQKKGLSKACKKCPHRRVT